MISVEDSLTHSNPNITTPYTQTRRYCCYTPSPSSSRISRSVGRSMRTIRSNIFSVHQSGPIPEKPLSVSENLTDSVIDLRLGELASKSSRNTKNLSLDNIDDILDISTTFSDISDCSSDLSGEIQRLANLPYPSLNECASSDPELKLFSEFLLREMFSTEIIENISPEDLQQTVKLCVYGLQSTSFSVKRSAAAKLRLLAKNRAENRALIGESEAAPALVPLLRCSDPMTQEHAVTALLNLSLHEGNKSVITNAGGIKSLVYALKTGTETSKQNAACALLSLALVEDYKLSIGASGAIPPLVGLLINGTNRGKKDALTTLYKLCSVKHNKERAISAGAVRPLVGLVWEQGTGLAEKAMVVLNSLVTIEMGKVAVVEEGAIAALVEAIEDGSEKAKEFAVLILFQLCADSVTNRGLLVREGGIPPLVALSQTAVAKAKQKAERLLAYVREARWEAPIP